MRCIQRWGELDLTCRDFAIPSPLTDSEIYWLEKYSEIFGTYDSLVIFEPLNYNVGEEFFGEKEIPNLSIKTCGISLALRQKMVEWKFDYETSPYKYILEKHSFVDIDDVYDFACAWAWLDM